MKKFIKQVLLFIAPIIILAYYIDLFISNNLKKSNWFANKEYPTWNAIIEGKVNSDVLVYGSSRAWVHIDPAMISDSLGISSYNLGIDGHNFWLQYLRHRMLLKNNKKPKLIILSIDHATFQNSEDLYNLEQFLPYMLWNNDIEQFTTSYEGFNFFDYNVPLIRYYGNYISIKLAIRYYTGYLSNPIHRIKGYEGQDAVWNGDFEKAKLTMKQYKIKFDYQTIVLFEQFIKECQQNNIKLIFVLTPEYIEGQKFIENRQEFLALCQKYNQFYQIPFYDFSNDSISYQKKYFYNATHMNKLGSQLFTKKLIDTLKSSGVLSTKPIK